MAHILVKSNFGNLVYKSLTWDTPQILTEALFLNDVFLLVALVRFNVGHNLTTYDDLDELRQVLAPDIRHLSIKRTNTESVDESRVALAQKNETACSRREIETKQLRNKAIVDYTLPALCTSVTPFPPIGDAAYHQHAGGPSHRHRQHAQKFGKDRARGSGDILADRHTDRHTQFTHHNTLQPLPRAK